MMVVVTSSLPISFCPSDAIIRFLYLFGILRLLHPKSNIPWFRCLESWLLALYIRTSHLSRDRIPPTCNYGTSSPLWIFYLSHIFRLAP